MTLVGYVLILFFKAVGTLRRGWRRRPALPIGSPLGISGQALRLLRSATLEQRHAGCVGLWNGLRPRCITAIAEATMAPKPHSLGLDPGNHQAPGSCFVGNASAQ